MNNSEIVQGVIALLDSPDKWAKWETRRTDYETNMISYCLGGAAIEVTGVDGWQAWELVPVFSVWDRLAADRGFEGCPGVLGGAFADFNNDDGTQFEDIQSFLNESLELLEGSVN